MKETLTQTKMRDFMNCQRYFYLRHEQRLTLKTQKPGRRRGHIFGLAIFAAVTENKVAQEQGQERIGWADLESTINNVVRDAYDEIMDSAKDDDERRELEVEEVKVQVMALEYCLRYGFDTRRELIFKLPLRNPRTNYPSRTFERGGKIDGMIRTGPRACTLVEDKFVGSITRIMIQRLPLDFQMSEYVDALVEHGWTVQVEYRHTRLPGINPEKAKVLKTKTKAAESLDEYRARLRADIASREDFYFDKQLLFFETTRLDEHRMARWNISRRIARSRKEGDWDQNASKCLEFGGCEYLPICTGMDPDLMLYEVQTDDNPELVEESEE